MNKQNNGLRAFFAVLMCIPLGFIIYFAVLYANHNIPVSEVVSVSVTSGDGKVYNYTDEDTRAFFLDVYLDAVADDRASGAVAFADNNVLSQSFLGALNIRHGSLKFLKLVKIIVCFSTRRKEERLSSKTMGKF